MSKFKNEINTYKTFSNSKFDLLTETKYNQKENPKKQIIKNIYKNPYIELSGRSIFQSKNIIKKKKKNKIKSLDNIKLDLESHQYLLNKKNNLSPIKFIQSVKSRNENLIRSTILSENRKKLLSEKNILNEPLPILKNIKSLNTYQIEKDYKKKYIDDNVKNILFNELISAKNIVNLKLNQKLRKLKNNFSNPKIKIHIRNYLDKNKNFNDKEKENHNKVNLKDLHYIRKIKLLHTPSFFEINSNTTQKAIIKDNEIMSKFEKYNFSKIS